MTKKHKKANAHNKDIDIDYSDLEPTSSEFMRMIHDELEERVSPKRLKHIDGVADTAEEIARAYGKDPETARLAGLLHDWDKGMDNDKIRKRVTELGIEDDVGPWIVENMPEVIHGISASYALKNQFPRIPDDVIHAIKVHTTACPDMSDLDKILYIADAIEPGRKFEQLPALREMVGEVELDELYFEVYKLWTNLLIMRGRALHPDTIRIWNDLCIKRKNAGK